jgi:hypothetical protein
MARTGTEQRLDELSRRVDFGFEQTNQRLGLVEEDVRALRTEMNHRFETVDARFDRLQHLMIRFFAGTLGTVIAGVIVTVATVLLHS